MSTAPETKKVYIKTYGCQMNEYDSDKMSDVMNAAQGYTPTNDPEEADLILFNTCSIREKAQEKVFSDLGRVKHLKDKGVMIGVGGCVASQEGAAIIARAPYVDVVFGPQTLHRLPEMLDGVAPLFVEQMKLLQAVSDQPQKARELVTEFGMQGINTISQQLLDLPPVRPKRGRPRKHATP